MEHLLITQQTPRRAAVTGGWGSVCEALRHEWDARLAIERAKTEQMRLTVQQAADHEKTERARVAAELDRARMAAELDRARIDQQWRIQPEQSGARPHVLVQPQPMPRRNGVRGRRVFRTAADGTVTVYKSVKEAAAAAGISSQTMSRKLAQNSRRTVTH